jgi:hypothetical protein
MPFHGYGQGDARYDEASKGQNNQTERNRYPERTQVAGHPNNGPVDLSKYGTPTGRGSWAFGKKKRGMYTELHSQGFISRVLLLLLNSISLQLQKTTKGIIGKIN